MEKQVSTQTSIWLTPEEYLLLQSTAEAKSEYLNGEIFPMSGVSREHNLICLNIATDLQLQLMDRACELYAIDVLTKILSTGLYTYPDVVVVCEEPKFEHFRIDVLLNPNLIVEVLSDSTESYDRGKKFAHYRTIDSLKEYVLVSQYECRVEQYVRQPDDKWLYTETTDPAGSIELPSITCRLSLSHIYQRIDFEAARARQNSGSDAV